MTVIAAEAIPAAETVTTTAASTGAAAGAGSKAAAGKTAKAPPKQGLSTRTTTRTKPKAKAREIVYTTPGGKERSAVIPEASVPEHTWHRWIMAEFVICVVMIGASPFLQPGANANPEKQQPGKTLAAPLIRLTAISVVFFILALAAQGQKSGKIAAAFGSLVTLGVTYNALPEWVSLGAMFGGKAPKAVEGSAGPVPGTGAAWEGSAGTLPAPAAWEGTAGEVQ